jgi:flagellar assembly factor FliW
MKFQTTRFGAVNVADSDLVNFPEGLLGLEHLKRFFIVDPSDETLILWLQSADEADVAFPILEPKLFKNDYRVRLSGNELRSLKIENSSSKDALVYSILTIPADVAQMTANLKAPLVISSSARLGRQVVLQENEYSVRFAMYKELLAVMLAGGSAPLESGKGAEPTAVSLASTRSRVEVSAL